MTADGSTIDLPASQVYALAAGLTAQAEEADAAAARLTASPRVGSPLQSAVDDLLDCHRTAAGAFAGELRWLGSTIAAVADSWFALDSALARGKVRAQ